MSISIIIPHWSKTPEHDDMLERCIESLPKEYDEVILSVNEGTGFTKAVNLGLRAARGDYLMVVNNDIIWKEGTLAKLCIEKTVTSPMLNGGLQRFWGCFFVIPRTIHQKLGELDERFILYWSDTDYVKRMQVEGVQYRGVETCKITSEGGRSTRHLPNRFELESDDAKRFKEKWGIDQLEI